MLVITLAIVNDDNMADLVATSEGYLSAKSSNTRPYSISSSVVNGGLDSNCCSS